MNILTSLYTTAHNENILTTMFPLNSISSMIIYDEENVAIGINSSINSTIQETICLAHELGHYFTGTYYEVYSPLQIRGQAENRADAWMVKRLVPISLLVPALRSGIIKIYDLAEYFNVTESVIKKAIEIYQQKELL